METTFAIDKRTLTVTASDHYKYEGGSDPIFKYSLTSGALVGSDVFSGVLSREAGEVPGTYWITMGTLSASENYDLTLIPGKFYVYESAEPDTSQVLVIINGSQENIGKQSLSQDIDGVPTIQLTVSALDAVKRIEQLLLNDAAERNTFIVPVLGPENNLLKLNLTGDVIHRLEQDDFEIHIQKNNLTYLIPANEFTILSVADKLSVTLSELRDIDIEIRMGRVSESIKTRFETEVRQNGGTLVLPPVAFEIVARTLKSDGTIEKTSISSFSRYVSRIIELPQGLDSKKISTGIVFNPDGTYSHVPTIIYQENGKWYARINSLTNSQYGLIFQSVEVPSVERHWSRSAVEDMSVRLVLTTPETFSADDNITRSEFADYMVRALGLYRKEHPVYGVFNDLSISHPHLKAIEIAERYGILAGYADGTFRPDQKISRQEAMAMFSNAMKITALSGVNNNRYQLYRDFEEVSQWAAPYVRDVLAAKVFNGTTPDLLSPKANLTHAEALSAIRNLLLQSGLIND